MSVASTDLQPREVKIELDSSQLFSQDEQVAPSNDGLDSPVDDTPGAALQKRRRVTRACDECRKKVSSVTLEPKIRVVFDANSRRS